MVGNVDGFKIYQNYLVWQNNNPGELIDVIVMEKIMRLWLQYRVTGIRWNEEL